MSRGRRHAAPGRPRVPLPRPALARTALLVAGVGLGATTALTFTAETAGEFAAPGGPATFAGNLTGMIGTYLALLMVLLVSRIPAIERVLGHRLRRGGARLGDLPREVAQVAAECQAARQASGGWFDPWAMPGGFDPTGLVKGWAVERALAALRRSGIAAAMVNGGGDLAAFGSPAPGRRWRVGIRHPWRADALAGIIEVGAAVATSGCYERGPHLIDPATGLASGRAASATVTGPSLAMADAVATAVAVGGDDALAAVGRAGGYAAYLIRPDGNETGTGGITFVS